MSPTRYIHIGYPKNLSTTLQRDFFPVHSQILHLGVGVGSSIDYIDNEINLAMEDYLLYCKDFRYNERKQQIEECFNKWFSRAEKENYRAVGVSGELLSFSFTPDHIDTTIKANRLLEIFGKGTKIIMIIRNQAALLRSLYRECVKIGYPYSFKDFIEYTYYFQDRNFMYDFQYHFTYELYADLFGNENVTVISIEDVRDSVNGRLLEEDSKIKLIDSLCKALNVDYQDLELDHYNSPLTKKELHAMMYENRHRRHDIGNTLYEAVNGHRLEKYFNVDLGVPVPAGVTDDVIIKRENMAKARELGGLKNAAEIDYYCDPFIYDRLMKSFEISNERMSELAGIVLPEVYLNLSQMR